MSVTDPKVIDTIGTDPKTGEVRLSIADHLDWSDVQEHLSILQDKLNCYLGFIESGEMLSRVPQALGCQPVILIYAQYPRVEASNWFFEQVGRTLRESGVRLRTVVVENGTAQTSPEN